MPVIIEANYAKKVGLPAYSSHQFSVTLRTELTDLSQLEQVNAELYSRLQTAVDSQIVQAGFIPGETPAPPPGNAIPRRAGYASASNASPAPAPAPASGNGDGPAWRCSDKQRDLILRIVDEHRLDKDEVENLSQTRFGSGVRQLNKLQASSLIDELLETYADRNPPASRRGGGGTGGTGGNGNRGGYRRAAWGRTAR
ncbi:hypothetical protein OpiT1DRAFT_00793 [Opitutaceae bacterium TAV1]|nr:hypothetical protein OPIT5_01305 [Opitutaceae bacterium TAV5]EIP96378.1 hypothetical protein OpiT1DRAFT_00793 [Opitutaceae bacterium TAV1]